MTGITPSSFMRQNALGFLSQSVSIATNLIFNIALPLLLGAALFGQMEIALGFAYLLAGLFDAGFNNAFMSVVSKKHAERKKSEIAGVFKKFLRLKMAFALILSFLMFSASSMLSNAYSIPLLTFQTASILIFFYALLSLTASFFIAIQKNQISLIGNILNAVFLISLPILFFYSGMKVNGIIAAVIISYFISSTTLFLIALDKVNKMGKATEPKEKFIRKIIGFSSVSMSMVFIYWGVLLILGLFSSSSEVAFFKVSLSWVLAVISIIPISASVIFSSFIEFNAENRKKMMKYAEKAFHYTFIFAVPMMFGLYLVGPKMIQAVYGAEFLRAGLSLTILCWAILPLFTNSFFVALFTAAGKLKKTILSLCYFNSNRTRCFNHTDFKIRIDRSSSFICFCQLFDFRFSSLFFKRNKNTIQANKTRCSIFNYERIYSLFPAFSSLNNNRNFTHNNISFSVLCFPLAD